MTPEQQRIAIAEAVGVKPELRDWHAESPDGSSICFSAETEYAVVSWLETLPKGSWAKDYVARPYYRYPDYTGSLDCMHEAEKALTMDQMRIYQDELIRWNNRAYRTGGPTHHGLWVIHATAAQRAEAFLRTIGKWEPEPEAPRCPSCRGTGLISDLIQCPACTPVTDRDREIARELEGRER
jgi:hypothetical protein